MNLINFVLNLQFPKICSIQKKIRTCYEITILIHEFYIALGM